MWRVIYRKQNLRSQHHHSRSTVTFWYSWLCDVIMDQSSSVREAEATKLLSHRLWSRGSPPPVLGLRFIMIQQLNELNVPWWITFLLSLTGIHNTSKQPAPTPLQPMVEVLLDSAGIQPGEYRDWRPERSERKWWTRPHRLSHESHDNTRQLGGQLASTCKECSARLLYKDFDSTIFNPFDQVPPWFSISMKPFKSWLAVFGSVEKVPSWDFNPITVCALRPSDWDLHFILPKVLGPLYAHRRISLRLQQSRVLARYLT